MGGSNSTEVVNDAHSLTEFLAESTVKSGVFAEKRINISQEQYYECKVDPEIEKIRSTSWACQACFASAGKDAPERCRSLCSVDCNYENIVQDGVFQFNTTTKLDAKAVANMSAKILEQYNQKLDNKEDALFKTLSTLVPFGSSKTSVSNKLDMTTRIKQIFTVENVNKIVTGLDALQKIEAKSGHVYGLRQSLAVTSIETAIEKTDAGSQLVIDFQKIIDQDIKNKQQTWLSDIVEAISKFMDQGLFFLLLILFGAYIGYKFLFGEDSDSD